MQKQLLEDVIISNIGYVPTDNQKSVVGKISDFLLQKNPYSLFILNGSAGTGKTTLINAIVKTLKNTHISYVLLAPTGRAAKVMSNYTGETAFTLHKFLYYYNYEESGDWKSQLKNNKSENAIFMVDEASLLSYNASAFGDYQQVLPDLINFVFSKPNNKLIFIGDTCQLPPIDSTISPAMDANAMESLFSLNVSNSTLSQVVRQSEDSAILSLAEFVRAKIETENADLPYIMIEENAADVTVVNGYEFLDNLESAYSRFGKNDVVLVTMSNKRANLFNKTIRERVFYQDFEINAGDMIMVVKNNYFWLKDIEQGGFIANGDIGEVLSIRNFEEIGEFKFADARIKLIDYEQPLTVEVKVLLNALWSEQAGLGSDKSFQLYNMVAQKYAHIASKAKRNESIRNDEYYNALHIKFSYSLTCHKTQGGQWKAVFVENPFYNESMQTVENLKWLYTAITRATDKLYLVNFEKQFIK
ncbi:MAG: ATP-dependent DNA helicase [Bacteroidales bacterium]|jgi:exodeoxyribonuclease-5